MYIGSDQGDGGDKLGNPVLKPSEAKMLDRKMDDGEPDRGNVYVIGGWGSGDGCVQNGTSQSNAGDYILSRTDRTCKMVFWLN